MVLIDFATLKYINERPPSRHQRDEAISMPRGSLKTGHPRYCHARRPIGMRSAFFWPASEASAGPGPEGKPRSGKTSRGGGLSACGGPLALALRGSECSLLGCSRSSPGRKRSSAASDGPRGGPRASPGPPETRSEMSNVEHSENGQMTGLTKRPICPD